ncbi:BlaR1 family beta-lactam sensor/signal transducer [Clostridium botulinum]|uniref:BlaR1 family beta-lactam sensor/signal transducer n=1 Tax=Clostridium botulinum TaxID=1491 RepID=UPI00099D6FC2|nr:BlaR1 family beta-lactam sensor/signal transducer [Clostridium botulinum]NFK35402.1 BlaR1 family beta-lactam sensor/signal transducer [Clostridium botulinum H04402 065]NFB15695.1 BlaR1 family beta-lactam sensor/signal transducer [Clostridium botulinum]NFB66119.1 BlaR1 family beta-lactam sensor/signal transducer [Clostridium botulinum]NFB96917.1 BlaR1 family beta-lactam sensor/signal transducer [Clostridium botulinum]NFC57761.1 BlaR1 family beta-lactam sensor/signal transducer [Clostridium b
MKAYNFLSYMSYSTISITLVIIALILIRGIFGKWVSTKHKYYLWLILIIKLIIPFTPNWNGDNFNFINWFSKSLVTNANAAMDKVGNKYSSIPLIDNTKDYAVSVNVSNVYSFIFILWLLICVVILGFILVNSFRFKTKIIKSGYKPDNKLKIIIETCRKQLKMKNNKFNSLIVKGAHAAFVVGPVKPYVIISQDICDEFNDEEIKYILLHEIAHLKRKDIMIKFIMIIFCCIYWFNPFIWIARAIMMNDMELSCDEKVLSNLNKNEIQDYGKTIIKVLERFSLNRYKSIMLNINGSKKNVKNRIKNIAIFSKQTIRRRLFTFLLLVITLLLTITFIGVKTPFGNDKFKSLNLNVTYKDFSKNFNGDKGTFVLFNEQSNQYTIFNKEGSEKRVSPCSTYKIVIALIGLDKEVISKTDNNISWDGKNYPFTEWNKDQTLESAMKYSVTWYFDKIDRRINRKTLQECVDSLSYGNENIRTLDDQYWNQSSLKISAIEQVQFLKKLWNYDVKFKKEDVDFVKNSIKLMEEGDVVLYGKTGSGSENNKDVNGWFVGVLEKGNNKYYFATNIEGSNNINGQKAKSIAVDILKENKIIN